MYNRWEPVDLKQIEKISVGKIDWAWQFFAINLPEVWWLSNTCHWNLGRVLPRSLVWRMSIVMYKKTTLTKNCLPIPTPNSRQSIWRFLNSISHSFSGFELTIKYCNINAKKDGWMITQNCLITLNILNIGGLAKPTGGGKKCLGECFAAAPGPVEGVHKGQ